MFTKNAVIMETIMFDNATINHATECEVCCATHDEEIHEATLSVHRWLRYQVTRYLYDEEEIVAVQVA
jgi:hypothetical protein